LKFSVLSQDLLAADDGLGRRTLATLSALELSLARAEQSALCADMSWTLCR
jgi:hypothetical protein